MANVNLSESLGLIAYYESKDFDKKSIEELIQHRNALIKDFRSAQKTEDINYLIWIMIGYPKFIEGIIVESENAFNNTPKNIRDNKINILESILEAKNINKALDKVALKYTNNKLIRKYIKSKLYKDSDFDVTDQVAENDSDEVIKFLINFDQNYEKQVLSRLNN